MFDRRRSHQLFAAAAAMAAIAVVTTWPFRSEHLISWDAANFAFALDRIDIGAHRPHPPGYIGYVFVGRALRALVPDANAALTAWNVIVRSAAGLLITLLTLTATGGSARAALAAAAILLTSPLLWFYASNAEIYPSEMMFSLAVAYAACEALNGRRQAAYWMALVLALTALFKLSAMILIGPVALYAWSRAQPGTLARSAVLFMGVLAGIATLFYVIQPDFLNLLWAQFTSATVPSRIVDGTSSDIGETLNRNLRDTFTSLVAAVGIVNACVFVWWVIADRHLPAAIDRWLVLLWALPWLVLLIVIHIGNPGYVLPLLPVACLILGAWYARRSAPAFISLVVLQAAVNLAHIALLAPPSVAPDAPRYRDKSMVQRLASDLEPLTFPTRAYVRRSDEAIDRLLSVASDCVGGTWVVVAGAEPVDWRRTSYYVPTATAIRVRPDGSPEYVGHGATFTVVSTEPTPIDSACGLLWLSRAGLAPGLPLGGRPLDGLGWVFPPGVGAVSTGGITWAPHP